MTTPAPQLIPAPPVYELPLSKGGDLHVTLTYTIPDPNNPGGFVDAPWPADVTVELTIDTPTPTTVTADITGTVATLDLDYLIADSIGKGTSWRAVLHHPSGLDEVLVNGKVGRYDGK